MSHLNIYSRDDTLRKHAYSDILKILPPKHEKFQIKNSDMLGISAQNIDCGYLLELPQRGGSNKYPQSMFLSRNKQNNAYPCKPQFYYIKVGFKGSKLYRHVFVMKISEVFNLNNPHFLSQLSKVFEGLPLSFMHCMLGKNFICQYFQICVLFFPKNRILHIMQINVKSYFLVHEE